jgi:predicted transcriptional regulator
MGKITPLSVRLPEALSDQIGEIAAALDRPKSWVIEQALRDYVATQQWQLAAIDEGVQAADAGRLVDHEDVLSWVRSWGRSDELPPPECG